MTDTNWTVALAGTGEVTPENAIALLDDWLPVEGVGLLFPKLPRNAKTMREIVKWAETEEVDVLSDQEDLVGGLVGACNDGDQVYLVLAWDDTEASSKLLEQALAANIPVKDLTRALDDLEFEDEDVPAEPAVEPEQPKSSRSSRRKDSAEKVPTAEVTEGSEAEPKHVDGGDETPPVLPDAGVVVQAIATGPATIAPQGRQQLKTDNHSFAALALETLIREIIRDEYAKITAKPEKADVPVLVDDDGNYRLGGKGRPRKGETPAHITPSEARALGLLEE